MSRYDIIRNPDRPAFFDDPISRISRKFLDFSKIEVSSWEDFYDQTGFEGLLDWVGDANVRSHRISGGAHDSTIRVAIDVINEDGNRVVQLFLPSVIRQQIGAAEVSNQAASGRGSASGTHQSEC